MDGVVLQLCVNLDFRVVIAVGGGVFQNIIEHTSQLVRIRRNEQIFRWVDCDRLAPGLQHRIEFLRHLHQHVAKVKTLFLQNDLMQIVPGDLKKFVDQAFQTHCFFQPNIRVLGSLLPGHVRSLFQ